MGAKTPFKCLKPWIKNELAVNSDGNYVPCCLTLNSSINLGNIENETISEVFDSEEHYLLRESVFLNSLKNNSTCLTCPINEPNLEIPNELAESQSIEKLKKYIISDWRFFP
ncbi:SPASM domain-containing protein [Streptococcus pneumoniae]